MSDKIDVPCRTVVARPGERAEFSKTFDGDFIWVGVYQDENFCAVKISVEDFLRVANHLGFSLPAPSRVPSKKVEVAKKEEVRLESLKEIHAALGKIIG